MRISGIIVILIVSNSSAGNNSSNIIILAAQLLRGLPETSSAARGGRKPRPSPRSEVRCRDANRFGLGGSKPASTYSFAATPYELAAT